MWHSLGFYSLDFIPARLRKDLAQPGVSSTSPPFSARTSGAF